MKKINLIFKTILSIFVILAFVCSCTKTDDSKMIDEQTKEIRAFFVENQEKLVKIKDALNQVSFTIQYIEEDGYIVSESGKKIWLDNVSDEIKNLINTKKKGLYIVQSVWQRRIHEY